MSFFNEFAHFQVESYGSSLGLQPEHAQLAEELHQTMLFLSQPNIELSSLPPEANSFLHQYEVEQIPQLLPEIPRPMQTAIELQVHQRKVMTAYNKNSGVILDLLTTEHQELMAELNNHEFGEETTPFAVASELGDIYYLVIKHMHQEQITQEADLPVEIQQILEEARQVSEFTEIVPHHALHMKILRNEIKYLSRYLNDGIGYHKAVQLCREQWTDAGGDIAFSHWYLENGERMLAELDQAMTEVAHYQI